MPIDFDTIELHNLDRLSYATRRDVGRLKVDTQAEHLRACATADPFRVEPVNAAVFKEEGFRAALDAMCSVPALIVRGAATSLISLPTRT